jgi:hypothetical protein
MQRVHKFGQPQMVLPPTKFWEGPTSSFQGETSLDILIIAHKVFMVLSNDEKLLIFHHFVHDHLKLRLSWIPTLQLAPIPFL